MNKSTLVMLIIMVVFSAGIVWIYYTTPITPFEREVPFNKNVALQPVNENNLVKVFYVLFNDEGKSGEAIGCGDSVVSLEKEIPATTTPLAAALTLLLSDKKQTSTSTQGDLMNSLYQSSLKIDSIALTDGVANIKLKGRVQLSGVCDNPRFEAQLQQTALQFKSVKEANFYINGKPLEEVLSLK